jgi:DNA-damage-inducible protein J
MALITVRVPDAQKKKAANLFKSLGFDMSTAVNMFINEAVREEGLPFRPKRKRTSAEIAAEWKRESAWALKHGKRYDTVDDLFASFGL